MALTGKTIGQLDFLQFPTNDTLLPVEYIGDTYHTPFSSITYTEGAYSQFVSDADNGVLTPGRWYLMTDYQVCYDQPNYNNVKVPISTGNYMTGNTEPILLLATTTTGFSPTVYSTLHPKDKITYDITWNTTEVTNSPAKGRITERIDEFNNRTDYDHRSILFKRYNGYSYSENQPLSGLVGISGITGTTAVLYGNTGTTFNSNFSQGSIVAINNLNPKFFEIISVQSNSSATISGVTINETGNSLYYSGINDGVMSYHQPNIRQSQVFEYTTFGDATAINNYIGNYANLYVWNENPFILANNVFLDGSFTNNTIGNDSFNNTFNDDCDSNQIGDGFYNNSTNDDFDGNIIGDYFNNNYIAANFNNNRIGSDFNDNILLGGSFYRNNIGNEFNNNVWTNGDFQNNEIGNQFNNNKIYDDFYNNDIGNGYNGNDTYRNFNRNLIGNGYNNNTIYSDFYENEIGNVFNNNTISTLVDIGDYDFSGNRIGNGFNGNTIRVDFKDNNILNSFYSNNILSTFNTNTISNQFYQNNIYNAFNENNFGENVNANNFGSSSNIGVDSFTNNTIGGDFVNNNISGNTQYNTIGFNCNDNTVYWDFQKNTILTEFEGNTVGGTDNLGGLFEDNQIMSLFKGNNIQGYFKNNQIKTNFQSNELLDEFGFNNVGFYFFSNNISGITAGNTIGDGFEFNNIYGTFRHNTIGNYFNSNDVQNGFGFGNETYEGNRIGNNFIDNSIGEYFHNNTIPDNFSGNTVGNYFQRNIVNTYINGVDFTTYYGVISGITYSSPGTELTDGSYTNLTGTTNGIGVNATFDINVSGGTVTGITISNYGKLYLTGNTITILGTSIGGVVGQITTFTVGDLGTLTGTTGVYSNILAQGGSGSGAYFNVTVVDGLVDEVTISAPYGSDYQVDNVLTLSGNSFGSTADMAITVNSIYSDNVVITVSGVSETPPVYETFTCNIFERQGGVKRLSYYDDSDTLVITTLNND